MKVHRWKTITALAAAPLSVKPWTKISSLDGLWWCQVCWSRRWDAPVWPFDWWLGGVGKCRCRIGVELCGWWRRLAVESGK